MADMDLAERLEAVRRRIDAAAARAGRDPDDITLVAVTKFHPVEMIAALRALGVTDFGESRHPEARDKAQAFPDATWHFIGQLQTNKARQVARYADVIQSVDRPGLVDALAAADSPTRVLLQVDLSGEPGRGGVAPADAERLAERIVATGTLRLGGVMAVAPLGADPAAAFAELAGIAARVRRIEPDARWISAGMSADLEAAVAEGATHLRIGTAITGQRPVRPYAS